VAESALLKAIGSDEDRNVKTIDYRVRGCEKRERGSQVNGPERIAISRSLGMMSSKLAADIMLALARIFVGGARVFQGRIT
jgi:hypothetical protein